MSNPVELCEIAARIATAPARCGPVRVVAIDGGAASGKTTLAARLTALMPATQLVRCDDLLDGWDDQFTFWPRLRTILSDLTNGHIAHYCHYDWIAGRFGDEVIAVQPTGTLIVEGVSAIAACGDQASLRILLEVPRSIRERRWAERDGPLEPRWRQWLDDEDAYFAHHPPSADLHLTEVSYG